VRGGDRAAGVAGGREMAAPQRRACEAAERRRIEVEERRDKVGLLRERANLPPLARQWDFNRAAESAEYNALAACRGRSYGPTGLYLWGPARTGKTVLAWCLIQEQIERHLRRCLFSGVGQKN